MLNIVRHGAAVLQKKCFKAFPNVLLCKSLGPWGGAMHDPRDFILTKLNLLALGMLSAKYCPIGAAVLEKIF